MTFDEGLRDIESLEFAARVNIASDLRTFLRVAGNQESVTTVLSELASPQKQQRVFSEALRLSRLQVDLRYENPWDSALAVFVWVLSLRALQLARVAAEAAVQAPQCWWASRIAHDVLRGSLVRSTQASRRTDDFIPLVLPANLNNINAGENILLSDLVRQLSSRVAVQLYAQAVAGPMDDEQATITWRQEEPGYVGHSSTQLSATWHAERIVA